MIIYLDDGVVAVQGKETVYAACKRVKNDLKKVGLVENHEKSKWIPTHCPRWPGFVLDLERGKVKVPAEKLKPLQLQL